MRIRASGIVGVQTGSHWPVSAPGGRQHAMMAHLRTFSPTCGLLSRAAELIVCTRPHVCYNDDVTTTSDLARALARSRWRGTTAEERSLAMSEIRRQGWAKMTPEERRRVARERAAARKANNRKGLPA